MRREKEFVYISDFEYDNSLHVLRENFYFVIVIILCVFMRENVYISDFEFDNSLRVTRGKFRYCDTEFKNFLTA